MRAHLTIFLGRGTSKTTTNKKDDTCLDLQPSLDASVDVF